MYSNISVRHALNRLVTLPASCGAVYCNRSRLWICVFAAGGRAVSEPYYSQRARSVCVSLSAFFVNHFVSLFICLSLLNPIYIS